ncbi:MAG: vWA domain-containing protein [Bacteriovoracaceae bacterium]
MRKRRQIELFSLSFLDLISGALGAVIILYIAVPKSQKALENQKIEKVVDRSKEVAELQSKLQETQKRVATLQGELAEAKKPVEQPARGIDMDIGFKFGGKKIVFLIDTSYSMTQEDRMGQVKAGLKMLLTALPNSYQVEVVQFPWGERAPFKALWGQLKETNTANKYEAFEFIYDMRPNGGTPTRDVLEYVLANYKDISDIVLLSDGAPSLHNSNKKDDIHDILKVVKQRNTQKVQINTIGVGANFIHDKTSDQYQFLSLLSSYNNGFFVGF